MRLNIFTGNHDPDRRRTLLDLVSWLAEGFREVGADVTVSAEQMTFDRANIIFENSHPHFTDVFRSASAECRKATGRAMVFVLYITEIFDGVGFDDGGNGTGRERYTNFLAGADLFSGFLTTVPSNLDFLRRIAPASFFEFGYCRALDLSAHRRNPPEHVISFSGGITPYRSAFLQAARDSGFKIYVPGRNVHTASAQTDVEYQTLVSSTAVNLCLRQHEDWPLPSAPRLARILHAATGAAVDSPPTTTELSRLFETFNGIDEFRVRYARLDVPEIMAGADDRLATYRARLPLAQEIMRNIEECPALAAH